jgi:hypothetical protein
MGAPSFPGFQLDQSFFGFKPSDRVTHHENLYNLLWYGEGRWTWDDIYYMPVHIRMYWIKRVNTYLQRQQEIHEKQTEKLKSISGKKTTT